MSFLYDMKGSIKFLIALLLVMGINAGLGIYKAYLALAPEDREAELHWWTSVVIIAILFFEFWSIQHWISYRGRLERRRLVIKGIIAYKKDKFILKYNCLTLLFIRLLDRYL